MNTKLNTENILGVPFIINSEKEVLEYITTRLENSNKKFYVVTPNPENLVLAGKNSSFKKALIEAEVVLPDGVGIVWASSLKGKGIKKRITGVDFMEKLVKEFAEQAVTVGFLGGKDGVAKVVADCYKKKYPKLQVFYVGEEWPDSMFQSTHQSKRRSATASSTNDVSSSSLNESLSPDQVPSQVSLSGETFNSFASSESPSGKGKTSPLKYVDFLFVAFGSPKQEIWIHDNLAKLPIKGAMGVGGAFDMVAGRVRRAPIFIQKAGIEWLWRLTLQPWRIKRQIRLIEFIWLVLGKG